MILTSVVMEKFYDSARWTQVNHEDRAKYCTVYKSDNGEFMVHNVPAPEPLAKFFYGLIKRAELRKGNKKYNSITLTDIEEFIDEFYKSYPQASKFNFKISGQSVNSIPEEDILCLYRFPIDKSYMVLTICGSIIFTSERKEGK